MSRESDDAKAVATGTLAALGMPHLLLPVAFGTCDQCFGTGLDLDIDDGVTPCQWCQ